MEIFEVGNRGKFEKFHDVVFQVKVGRKYAYISRESKGNVSDKVKVPKEWVKDRTFETVQDAWIRGIEEFT